MVESVQSCISRLICTFRLVDMSVVRASKKVRSSEIAEGLQGEVVSSVVVCLYKGTFLLRLAQYRLSTLPQCRHVFHLLHNTLPAVQEARTTDKIGLAQRKENWTLLALLNRYFTNVFGGESSLNGLL